MNAFFGHDVNQGHGKILQTLWMLPRSLSDFQFLSVSISVPSLSPSQSQSQSSSSCCICRVSSSLWTFFAKDTWGYDSSVVLWRRWNQIMTYWVSDWQGHQLRCPGQLIMNQILIAALLWLYRAHKRNVMLFPGPSFNLLSPSTVDFLVLAFIMTRGRAPNKILISFF